MSCASMAATRACQSLSCKSSMLRAATAQASGLAMNVGPCISTPPSAETPWATRVVARVAARLR